MAFHALTAKAENRIHQVFEVSIILKGIGAVAETLLGILLLFTMQVGDVIVTMIQNELIDDPNDFFVTNVSKYSYLLSPHAQFIGALYLLSHGIVKVALVWGLLKNKLWAYPASLAVLVLFIAYQVIKILQTHSTGLIILTIYDLIVLWLIWHEYRLMSSRKSATI